MHGRLTRVPNSSWFAVPCPTNGTLALRSLRCEQDHFAWRLANKKLWPQQRHGSRTIRGIGSTGLRGQISETGELWGQGSSSLCGLKHVETSRIFMDLLGILSQCHQCCVEFETGDRTARVSIASTLWHPHSTVLCAPEVSSRNLGSRGMNYKVRSAMARVFLSVVLLWSVCKPFHMFHMFNMFHMFHMFKLIQDCWTGPFWIISRKILSWCPCHFLQASCWKIMQPCWEIDTEIILDRLSCRLELPRYWALWILMVSWWLRCCHEVQDSFHAAGSVFRVIYRQLWLSMEISAIWSVNVHSHWTFFNLCSLLSIE